MVMGMIPHFIIKSDRGVQLSYLLCTDAYSTYSQNKRDLFEKERHIFILY